MSTTTMSRSLPLQDLQVVKVEHRGVPDTHPAPLRLGLESGHHEFPPLLNLQTKTEQGSTDP